jgi:hypothetical protein
MSQKSSVPQAAKSVSQELIPDMRSVTIRHELKRLRISPCRAQVSPPFGLVGRYRVYPVSYGRSQICRDGIGCQSKRANIFFGKAFRSIGGGWPPDIQGTDDFTI